MDSKEEQEGGQEVSAPISGLLGDLFSGTG